MTDPERIKKGLQDISDDLFIQARCPYWQETCEEALEYIALLEERIAIMTEGKEVKYTPEKGKLYDQEYWLCGNCNEPFEIGNVDRKYLRNYCYLCGAKVDKGEEDEDQRTTP